MWPVDGASTEPDEHGPNLLRQRNFRRPPICGQKINAMAIVDDLTSEQLSGHFRLWLARFQQQLTPVHGNQADANVRIAELTATLLRIPTTHTWGHFKRTDVNTGFEQYAHELILFRDNALLAARNSSHQYSDPQNTFIDEEVGLQYFVFAYLGTHEPHHSRGHWPGFGVFIAPGAPAEQFPAVNATVRNLDSPVVKKGPFPHNEYFVHPEHARHLAAQDTVYTHDGDIWHYLGGASHLADPTYVATRWQWLYEFHYKERIDTELFDAILWPVVRMPRAMEMGWTDRNRLATDMQRFRELHPACHIVQYRVHPSFPSRSFLVAAAHTMRSVVANEDYPTMIGLNGELIV